jgi:hypothetical protein
VQLIARAHLADLVIIRSHCVGLDVLIRGALRSMKNSHAGSVASIFFTSPRATTRRWISYGFR